MRSVAACICMVLLAGVPTSALAELQISVDTDKDAYVAGEVVVVSGRADPVIEGRQATLRLFSDGNVVGVAQIMIARDGSYSHTIIADGPLWSKTGQYRVSVSYGDGIVAEAGFEFLGESGPVTSSMDFEVDAGRHGTFDVGYEITGGDVADIRVNSEIFGLVVQIEAEGQGTVTLELPREFIDAKDQDGGDEEFIVLVDGAPVSHEELDAGSDSRRISVGFGSGDRKIEVIGTHVLPEFGGVAMAIMVAGILAATLASRGRLLPRA